jgi:prefoldin subunit 5
MDKYLMLTKLFFSLFYTSLWLVFPKEQNYSVKIPDIEKSLALIKTLQKKRDEDDEDAVVVTRYNLCDNVYGKAEVDTSVAIVNLWLGANVMLEYTYEEAIDFLEQNLSRAQTEFESVQEDLALVRDQIVTSEVSMSRIFNWDVRRKRAIAAAATATVETNPAPTTSDDITTTTTDTTST